MDDSRVISAFTEEQVQRLTGLTAAQLRYWDRIGFFAPQYAADSRRTPYSRIYSFKDVVGLKTLAILRNTYRVSLPHLRKVAEELSRYSKTPWADIRLKVWNRQVQFDEPDTGKTRGVVDGQYMLLPILDVMEDLERDAAALRQRKKEQIGKVERHRFVSRNADVIAGTRIPVAAIQRLAEDGYSTAQIVAEYPHLKTADIKAALQHAGANKAA